MTIKQLSFAVALLAACLPGEAASLRGLHMPTELPLSKKADGYHLSIPALPLLVIPDLSDPVIVEVYPSGRGQIAARGAALLTDQNGHACDNDFAPCFNPAGSAFLEIGMRFSLVVDPLNGFSVPGPGRYRLVIRLQAKNRKGDQIWLESEPTEVVAFEEKAQTQVLGSIEQIQGPRPPPYKDFVSIIVRIHSPIELAGAQLDLVTESHDRGQVRAQFPLGGLYDFTLPTATVAELTKQRKRRERFEGMVDGGTPPEMISDAITLTQIRMTDLLTPPAPFPAKP